MTELTKHASPTIAYRMSHPPHPRQWQPCRAPSRTSPDDTFAAGLGRSLQLSRAGMLALTRLQLAIRCNDRDAALMSLDRLHMLDAELERIVDRLPSPAADDPGHDEWNAMAGQLTDQKVALAFEKLAMMSAISGPDMVSPPPPDFGPSRNAEPVADWPGLPDLRPIEWKSPPAWLLGLAATLLTMAAIAAATVLLAGP